MLIREATPADVPAIMQLTHLAKNGDIKPIAIN